MITTSIKLNDVPRAGQSTDVDGKWHFPPFEDDHDRTTREIGGNLEDNLSKVSRRSPKIGFVSKTDVWIAYELIDRNLI